MSEPKVGKLLLSGSNSCEDYEWEDTCAEITALMGGVSLWRAEVSGFGWRSIGGVIERLEAQTGRALLLGILPQTCCSFKVYRYGRNGFAIDNSHHDKPCGGEWYYLRPIQSK